MRVTPSARCAPHAGMVRFSLFALVALVVLEHCLGGGGRTETAMGGTENLCYKVKYKVKSKRHQVARLMTRWGW
jgi:hypothetical protein